MACCIHRVRRILLLEEGWEGTFQILPENNRKYSPGLFPQEAREEIPTFARKRSWGGLGVEGSLVHSFYTKSRQDVPPCFAGKEWGGPSLAPSGTQTHALEKKWAHPLQKRKKLLPKKDRASLCLAPSRRRIDWGTLSQECKGLRPQQEWGYRRYPAKSRGGLFLAFPYSREDSAAFCPEREWALSTGSFPPFPQKKSGNWVFQNMEEEACRTPSLTKS